MLAQRHLIAVTLDDNYHQLINSIRLLTTVQLFEFVKKLLKFGMPFKHSGNVPLYSLCVRHFYQCTLYMLSRVSFLLMLCTVHAYCASLPYYVLSWQCTVHQLSSFNQLQCMF